VAKKKKKKAKKAARKTAKKAAKKTAKKAARKTPKKAAKKTAKKAAKKKAARKKPAGRKTAARKTFAVPAGGSVAPLLPGMAEGIETEEFEPEVGLVADDEDDDEEVDFPEAEEIVATPDLEKRADDDEGEW
jgi:hypothetical protein